MNWGLSLREKPTRRTTVVFVLLSWVGILFMFRGALWGEAILAPLDIPPKLFTHYQWIDPMAGKVPRNHYVIDMFDFDLPLTYLAHRSLQIGEFPWWNPYCDGGRTLAMEPHLGVTDPVRLLMLQIPDFLTAYNWSRILQCFLSGLTMFALLRFFGFSQFSTVLGALSFQFCGFQASFFYPYIHSVLYYPLLWLVLAKYSSTRPVAAIGWGALLCAAMIVSGSQQSHAYIALFLGCFVLGYGSCFRREILKLLLVAGGAFALGCALAAPILMPQIEVFALSAREVPRAAAGTYMLTGVLSLAAVFPWFTGSFRTLDIGKLLEQSGAAYAVYVGSAAMILAAIAIFAGRKSPRAGQPETRMALLLVVLYFVGICSTPLLKMLYFRSALLGVLGVVVLFATGLEVLLNNTWPNARKVVKAIVALLAAGLVLSHVFALFVYPRIKEKVLGKALERDARNITLPSSPELRRFQVNNLANEITFKNPEPLLAFLGCVALLGLASAQLKHRRIAAVSVFAFNLLPLLIFSTRSLPYSPVEYWEALLRGGPEQKNIVRMVGNDLRLLERVPDRFDHAFPGTTPSLYGVHAMGGYTSLPLRGPGQVGSARDYNVLRVVRQPRAEGELSIVRTNQVRFVWADEQGRELTIVRETPNSIQLRIAAGARGELVRTDTYYPGWRVERPEAITQRRNSEGFLAYSIPAQATELFLRYRPSHFGATILTSLISLAIIAGLLLFGIRRDRPRQTAQVCPS